MHIVVDFRLFKGKKIKVNREVIEEYDLRALIGNIPYSDLEDLFRGYLHKKLGIDPKAVLLDYEVSRE